MNCKDCPLEACSTSCPFGRIKEDKKMKKFVLKEPIQMEEHQPCRFVDVLDTPYYFSSWCVLAGPSSVCDGGINNRPMWCQLHEVTDIIPAAEHG